MWLSCDVCRRYARLKLAGLHDVDYRTRERPKRSSESDFDSGGRSVQGTERTVPLLWHAVKLSEWFIVTLKLENGGLMQERREAGPSNSALTAGSPLAEVIAKYGAAMCVAALCTAFVFDYTFWLIVDPRMLTYMVLADHIQTAVHIFGLISIVLGASWLLTLVLVYAGLAVTRLNQLWKVATGLAVLAFGLLGLGIVTSGLPINLFDRTTVYTMSVGLVGIVMLGLVSHRSRPSKAEGGVHHKPPFILGRALWAIVPFCLFLSIADAVLRAWGTWEATPTHDVVSLERNSTLAGNVIRLVDRGVILRNHKDRRIVFVPKEHVRQIDHRVPSGSDS
jgi:hypothetical protein